METQETKTSRFLTSIMPTVSTKVGFDTGNLFEAMAIIFFVVLLVMLTWFALQKKFK